MTVARWVLAFVLACGLCACAKQGPSAGTVVKKRHIPASEEWIPGVDVPGSCNMIGKIEECDPGVHVPGHYQDNPEEWQLYLQADPKHKGWRDVDPGTYERCDVGQFCNTK